MTATSFRYSLAVNEIGAFVAGTTGRRNPGRLPSKCLLCASARRQYFGAFRKDQVGGACVGIFWGTCLRDVLFDILATEDCSSRFEIQSDVVLEDHSAAEVDAGTESHQTSTLAISAIDGCVDGRRIQ